MAILASTEKRLALLDASQAGLVVLLTQGAALGILLSAIGQVDGIMLASLALATVAAFEAILPLEQAAVQAGVNTAAVRRLFEMADQQPAVQDWHHGAACRCVQHHVARKHSYRPP